LIGNKSDMADERRAVPYARAKALADEYRIPFFETSAKDNINVEEVRLRAGRVLAAIAVPLCVPLAPSVLEWASLPYVARVPHGAAGEPA
jgi:hypothetical protein